MDISCMESSPDFIPFEKLSALKLVSSQSGISFYDAVLNQEKKESVRLSVLTVEDKLTKGKFVHEAALLKLLKHKGISQFLGICLVPTKYAKTNSNGNSDRLAYITKAAEGVTLEHYLNDLPEKPSRKKPYPFDDMLNILIDTADAMQYLHERKPKLIHRSISTATVRVLTNDNKVSGKLTTFKNALLSVEKGFRAPRLGMDSFENDSLVSEDLLSLDFFKPTLMLPMTSFPAPLKRPQSFPVCEEDAQPPRSKSSMAKLSTSRDKTSNSRNVSFSTEVTLFGSGSVTSSLGSNINNQTTPDPEHGATLTRISRKVKGVKSDSHISIPVIRTKAAKAKDQQKKHGTAIKKTIEEQSSYLSDFAEEMGLVRDQNNALLSENRSGQTVRRENRGNSNDSSVGFDSVSSVKWNKNSPKAEKEDVSNATLNIESSEISIVLDEKIPEMGMESVSTLEEPKTSLQGIYREASMHLLKRQPGIILPPEIHEKKSYDSSMDVYHFGIVIYKALTKTMPMIQPHSKGHVRFAFPNNFPKEAEELITKCCNRNAEERPTAKEIGEQLRLLKESGSLNILNKKIRSNFLCFCGTP